MNKNKGFTLIELLIVITIIGILAAISIPAYIGQQQSAARSEAYKNLEAIRLLEEQFFAENAQYTATAANTAAIQALLPGFLVSQNVKFTYAVTNGVALTTPVPVPYAGGTAAMTNCFVATATGNANTRVAGDIYAIDCNDNKNF